MPFIIIIHCKKCEPFIQSLQNITHKKWIFSFLISERMFKIFLHPFSSYKDERCVQLTSALPELVIRPLKCRSCVLNRSCFLQLILIPIIHNFIQLLTINDIFSKFVQLKRGSLHKLYKRTLISVFFSTDILYWVIFLFTLKKVLNLKSYTYTYIYC